MAEIAEEIVTDLEKFYGRNLNASAIKFYASMICFAEADDLIRAAIELKQHERQFPTVSTIKKYIEDARVERYRKQKFKEMANRHPLSNPDQCNTERGRLWLQGIIQVCEGRITADELIRKMGAP